MMLVRLIFGVSSWSEYDVGNWGTRFGPIVLGSISSVL